MIPLALFIDKNDAQKLEAEIFEKRSSWIHANMFLTRVDFPNNQMLFLFWIRGYDVYKIQDTIKKIRPDLPGLGYSYEIAPKELDYVFIKEAHAHPSLRKLMAQDLERYFTEHSIP
jgi:hypothetical protein